MTHGSRPRPERRTWKATTIKNEVVLDHVRKSPAVHTVMQSLHTDTVMCAPHSLY